MNLVEIRELDGPNIFLLEPAIKIEYSDVDPEQVHQELSNFISVDEFRTADMSSILGLLELIAIRAQQAAGVSGMRTTAVESETPGHLAIIFGWTNRRVALAIADSICKQIAGQPFEIDAAACAAWISEPDPDDPPSMVSDSQRTVRIVSVTGTNGKTTTTRLIAHIVTSVGLHAGWSSSSGVYLDGEQVIDGDYSGPSGARRVLATPEVDVAILETARGGILLRGIAYESNDVSVFTNISADHLDLQGVHTVEGLARAKSVVCQITRPAGVAVLNAEDTLVIAATVSIPARKLLFAMRSDAPELVSHLESGGEGVYLLDDAFVHHRNGVGNRLLTVAEAPVTLGGLAAHMTQNALAAIGAAVALGISDEDIAAALVSFRNNPELNQGRLNLFDVDGATVIVDFAHNEAGLRALLGLARQLAAPTGRVIASIGTAGDRTAESLRDLGRIAAAESDLVLIKGTRKYLRGRTNDEMIRLYAEGLSEGPPREVEVLEDEFAAFVRGLELLRPGDVLALMAHEHVAEILDHLSKVGIART